MEAERCVRGIVGTSVMLILVMGVLITSLGAYIHLGNDIPLPDNPVVVGIYLIGLLVLLLGLLGSLALKTQRPVITMMYLFGLIAVLVLKVYACIILSMRGVSEDEMHGLWLGAGKNGQIMIQHTFRCCGFTEGYLDAVLPCSYSDYCYPKITSCFGTWPGCWIRWFLLFMSGCHLFNILAVTFLSGRETACQGKARVLEGDEAL